MFIGRERELIELKRLLEGENSTIAVIYGRRRIGKSKLINQAFPDPICMSFEGLEDQPKQTQIDNFLFQLSEQTGVAKPDKKISNWREAFVLLKPHLKGRKKVIVLDEFQWMANYRSEIVSDLKMVWEQYLTKNKKLTMILCGSIASFMKKKVVKSSALYGRTDAIIQLDSFSLGNSLKMLKGFTKPEILEAYLCFGGIPKYLELINTNISLVQNVQNLAFSKNGYFVNEFERIFTSHFGKNPDFLKILNYLMAYPNGVSRKFLASSDELLQGGGLSDKLDDLESAGFIRSLIPFDKPLNSKIINYTISDPFIRLYMGFIASNTRKIQANTHDNMFMSIYTSPAFSSWMGKAFELACHNHVRQIAEVLGFSGIDYRYGPFFRNASKIDSGFQIDLAIDRADKILTLFEIKHRKTTIGIDIISEMEQKVSRIPKVVQSKHIQKVLIASGQVSKELVRSGYFSSIITADELFS